MENISDVGRYAGLPSGMPRFLRFVAITSFLLLCLYLFYPDPNSRNAKTLVTDKTRQTDGTKTNDLLLKPKLEGHDAKKFPTEVALRERLASIFPYDMDSMFPSFIWQTWKMTPSEKDFAFRTPEATWTEKHPDYIHEVRGFKYNSSLTGVYENCH